MPRPLAFTDEQTLLELQFFDVIIALQNLAVSQSAQDLIKKLKPNNQFKKIIFELNQTHERFKIFQERRTFPHLEFEELLNELKYLSIEDSVLTVDGFVRIVNASALVNDFLLFLDNNSQFQHLSYIFKDCYFTLELIERISSVIDCKQTKQVKDDASQELAKIRTEIKVLRQKINRNFEREMRRLLKDGYLGETTETFVANRRVLTVQSTFKRRVAGTILGTSKTGSLSYIEPKINQVLNHELECLLDDEKREIYRILKGLTAQIRGHFSLIKAYQEALVSFDVVTAKARLAIQMDASLPAITKDKSMEWKVAFHPILRATHQQFGKATIPQQFSLNRNHRMLVISGPNAGGKSITLKTFGLLQCMLQAGLLIPVHSDSKAALFSNLFSDIGDNQSIENELSTYSYRLQRMKFFLTHFNADSCLLLDEFGTGSDPELGAALAEVFFEQLYSQKGFAIITTHYAPIKGKASDLPEAMNGSMKFDVKTLKPIYQLELGMPGSSFTFEVAEINGIPKQLIQNAKKRLSQETKRLNELLSGLETEKRYHQKMVQEHKNAQEAVQKEFMELQEQLDQNRKKAKLLQQQAEEQNKWLQLGQRMEKYLNRFQPSARKRKENDALLDEIRAFFLKSTVKPKVQTKPKRNPIKAPLPLVQFKAGDKVRIVGTKQSGLIESIEKNKANLSVNSMKLSVSLDKLMPF